MKSPQNNQLSSPTEKDIAPITEGGKEGNAFEQFKQQREAFINQRTHLKEIVQRQPRGVVGILRKWMDQ